MIASDGSNASQELRSERTRLFEPNRNELRQFLNCCDCVASSLDEIEASKNTDMIFGKSSWMWQKMSFRECFSAIKRIFGETVRATYADGMFGEVRRMLTFYTIILGL